MLWIKRIMTADNAADHQGETSEQPAFRHFPLDRLPQEDDLHYCERRIEEEEHLAHEAGSWEAGLIHDQTAMLYRAQLATLRRLHEDRDQPSAP